MALTTGIGVPNIDLRELTRQECRFLANHNYIRGILEMVVMSILVFSIGKAISFQ
jgi:hypothetical protein